MRSGKPTQDVYNCVGGTCDEFVSKIILVLGNFCFNGIAYCTVCVKKSYVSSLLKDRLMKRMLSVKRPFCSACTNFVTYI